MSTKGDEPAPKFASITPLVAVSFATLLLGLLTPTLLFSQRLAVLEERMRVTIDGLAELRKDVQKGNEKLTDVRAAIAAQSYPKARQ